MANKLPKYPIQWHITTDCQQRCKHCYLWTNPALARQEKNAQLSPLQYRLVIASIAELCATLQVAPVYFLTGGDPLKHPNLFDIIRTINGPVKIMGNPHLLAPRMIEKLKDAGVLSYQLSLDGTRPTHDHWRGTGSFDKTIQALRRLNQYQIRSVIMFTLSKENATELPKVFDLCCQENVAKFAFARYSGSSMPLFSPTEYRNLLLQMLQKSHTAQQAGYQTKLVLKDHLYFLLRYELGLWKPKPQDKNLVYSGCQCGQTLTILSDGSVHACRRFPSYLGKMPEQSASNLFLSKPMEQFRNLQNYEKCHSCPLLNYCRGCPAIAQATTGNPFAPDPQCWRI